MKKSFAIAAGLVLLIASSVGMYIGSISGAIDNAINDGRLSLSSTDPAPSSDITGSTIYWVPNGKGNRIALLDQASSPQAWTLVNVPSAVSLAVPASANVNYDVFGNLSSGSMALSALPWFNDQLRGTELTTQDGVLVKSTAQTIDGYSTPNAFNTLYSGSYTRAGQAFALGASKTISGVKFSLAKTGSPTGNITAYLYACTGTPGSTGVPTGSALATSSTLDISTLSTSYAWTPFTFTTPYAATSGNYCVYVAYSGGDSSNKLAIQSNGAGIHAGNGFDYNGSYTAYTTTDYLFQLLATITDATAPAFRYLGTIRTSDILLDSQALDVAGITMYSGNNTVAGQAFAASTESMSGVSFRLWKTGSPTGTAVAKLYACSGTPGSTGVPTGAALATSSQFDVSQLNAYSTWYPFNFSTPYSGSAGNYCITIEYSGGNSSNYIYVNDNTASHAGNEFYNNSGSNVANASRDLCFKLYGYTTAISEDSATRRFIYNFYNQKPRRLLKWETAASWTYAYTTYRNVNSNTANKVEFVAGDVAALDLRCYGFTNYSSAYGIIGIGLDGIQSGNVVIDGGLYGATNATNLYSGQMVEISKWPVSAGYHYGAAVERCFSAASVTFIGSQQTGFSSQTTGLIGTIDQ